jgi:hypothetical protein
MITELRLQQNCFMWLHNTYPHLRGLFFRIKNEGHNRITGALNKATGIIPGVSDSVFLVPNSKPIFIEFKIDTGEQSQSQKYWQQLIEQFGYDYFIIKTENEFKELICRYI